MNLFILKISIFIQKSSNEKSTMFIRQDVVVTKMLPNFRIDRPHFQNVALWAENDYFSVFKRYCTNTAEHRAPSTARTIEMNFNRNKKSSF